MNLLLRLPIFLLEMALRGGAGAIKDILRLVSGGGSDDGYGAAPTPEAEADAAAYAGGRREAERVAAREAAARRPAARPSGARRRATRPRPTPTAAATTQPAPAPEAELLGDEPAHVSREAAPVASFGPADDPSPAIAVQPPWPNYDAHPAAEVVRRVRAGDEAMRAVVLLYERGHKARKSILTAAQGG
jgi:hypothetical protein